MPHIPYIIEYDSVSARVDAVCAASSLGTVCMSYFCVYVRVRVSELPAYVSIILRTIEAATPTTTSRRRASAQTATATATADERVAWLPLTRLSSMYLCVLYVCQLDLCASSSAVSASNDFNSVRYMLRCTHARAHLRITKPWSTRSTC